MSGALHQNTGGTGGSGLHEASGKHLACISLGSNMDSPWGGPEENLLQALERLKAEPGLNVEKISPVYLTEPQNLPDQPWFANAAACLRCKPDLTAPALLRQLQAIEQEMGRQRTLRFGPRVIDLDLLTFDREEWESADLTLPHPRLRERAFVLIPLRDIAPDLIIPCGTEGLRPGDLLAALDYRLEGRRIHQPNK